MEIIKKLLTNFGIGIPLLFVSGVLLLVGLFFIPQDNFAVWLTAKALYGVGVILFVLNK